ncbi:hypothetical protein DFH11DRAFT_813353 [Phellopilus nigrolimitatus]|nr:hypothetical protein DFH11DRAFT_813353 [Phellopilus nigrolimitatus]
MDLRSLSHYRIIYSFAVVGSSVCLTFLIGSCSLPSSAFSLEFVYVTVLSQSDLCTRVGRGSGMHMQRAACSMHMYYGGCVCINIIPTDRGVGYRKLRSLERNGIDSLIYDDSVLKCITPIECLPGQETTTLTWNLLRLRLQTISIRYAPLKQGEAYPEA